MKIRVGSRAQETGMQTNRQEESGETEKSMEGINSSSKKRIGLIA
jgi:hypothetical protein